MLPQKYLDYIAGWPVDGAAFAASMDGSPAVSVKLNRRKCPGPDSLGYAGAEPVAWCPSGWYLPERPQFTLNPLMHAGVFYVQEASSMIHEWIVGELKRSGLLGASSLVLDCCAAPGGKTTSVINALDDGAFVVANEFVAQRAQVLKENLLKWGFGNMMVTNGEVSRLSSAGEVFDLVVVDAPCSGEGMMRKEPKAVEQWSPSLVEQCASLQREILADAAQVLSPGGVLIYSTCTFNPMENEDNVRHMRDELGMLPLSLDVPAGWGISPSFSPDIPALRFMPHVTRGEGLFVAVLVKPGSPAPGADRRRVLDRIRKGCHVILDGIPATIRKGKVEIPASESVLRCGYDGEYPCVELTEADALRYLRHEAVTLAADAPRGYVAVAYKGHPLGLVKNIGTRANNLYPAAWRIRNL